METWANSEDPDEMQHHQGLHCLLKLKQRSGTEIHHKLETSNCDPLKYKMGKPTCIGKPIRIQRVMYFCQYI